MRLLLLAASVLLASTALAADWPQWRGPNRDEISTETNIRTDFKEVPKLVWSYTKAGNGYSGPAIVGNRLYCMGAEEGQEFAFCLDVEDGGKELWRVNLGKKFANGWGDGPRSTPTVDGERLYIIRGDGDLQCLNTKDGSNVWQKNFYKDFGGKLMSKWGYSESPLVDGDKLLCTPGGKVGSMVALDKKSGEMIWQSKDLQADAPYSSIIAADVFGVHQYIQLVDHGVTGIRASDGKMLWYYDRPNQNTAAIATPIYHDGYVYVTAEYDCGCDLIKLSNPGEEFKAEMVYANKNMANKHGGVVLVDDYVYGFTKRRGLICQNFLTGQIKWEQKVKGHSDTDSLTCAAGHLFCYDDRSGTLFVVQASPAGYKETGSFTIPKKSTIGSSQGAIWTHPVIANGKLYLRDQDLLFCFDVTK